MRKAAAVVATTVLVLSIVAAPPALALPAGDAPAACEAECALQRLRALLAPVQPAVELAAPALGELGSSVTGLHAAMAGGSVVELADAAGAVLHEIDALGDGLLALLRGAGVDVSALEAALGQLHDLAEAQLAPAGAPSPAPNAPGAAGAPATSTSASGSTSFGGVLSAAGVSSPDAATSPAIPDVPVGRLLELGPLALPRFDARPATSADELAAGAAVAELVRPAVAAAAAVPSAPDGTRATAVVMALSVLLLAAGPLLDQVRKARVAIRV